MTKALKIVAHPYDAAKLHMMATEMINTDTL
jgi:hypothetical protein